MYCMLGGHLQKLFSSPFKELLSICVSHPLPAAKSISHYYYHYYYSLTQFRPSLSLFLALSSFSSSTPQNNREARDCVHQQLSRGPLQIELQPHLDRSEQEPANRSQAAIQEAGQYFTTPEFLASWWKKIGVILWQRPGIKDLLFFPAHPPRKGEGKEDDRGSPFHTTLLFHFSPADRRRCNAS